MNSFISIPFIVYYLLLHVSCSYLTESSLGSTHSANTIEPSHHLLTFTSGIRSILHDSKGNYWMGSDKEGVCKYDGRTFTYFTEMNGFFAKQVISIQEDGKGYIWFGTSSGLCYYDGLQFHRVDSPKSTPSWASEPNHMTSWTIQPKDLWFPGRKIGELVRVENGKSYFITYPIQIPINENPNEYSITGFSKSKEGGLWIAHYSGVTYYDGKKVNLINNESLKLDGVNEYMHVRSLLEDSKGRLWIGNNGIGIQLLENGRITHFSKDKNLVKGTAYKVTSPPGTLMHVFAIAEDSSGNIWFGDRDTGPWRFDGQEMKNFSVDSTLHSNHIWSIYEDKAGNLLFTMADKGVYRFNGNGFERFF